MENISELELLQCEQKAKKTLLQSSLIGEFICIGWGPFVEKITFFFFFLELEV